ncbi:organic hydroperoxide resistance protein [Mucilaginibacter conchicola]|uniref:Organic hydroperoxide resistance protein n=1 Tax=Mucilaginibacter conchicola TaxID=2303333 RepID=A0A372NMR8_9SPHI|nr:organic hydroperoxide resistance protein [Mucilaginibacter conchicola]RFZ90244.1 organic hydroperoxide resistance protein [Mucilaginibacter conchicola]
MGNQQIFESNGNGSAIDKVLYTGKVHITGGRDGSAKSTDGHLDVKLTSPGTPGDGTNPEQLFAAGWSACFIGAMRHNASTLQIALPDDLAVNAEVDLALGSEGFALQARLNVSLPGLSDDDARKVIEKAHQTCPYSKATRGNINVQINLIR